MVSMVVFLSVSGFLLLVAGVAIAIATKERQGRVRAEAHADDQTKALLLLAELERGADRTRPSLRLVKTSMAILVTVGSWIVGRLWGVAKQHSIAVATAGAIAVTAATTTYAAIHAGVVSAPIAKPGRPVMTSMRTAAQGPAPAPLSAAPSTSTTMSTTTVTPMPSLTVTPAPSTSTSSTSVTLDYPTSTTIDMYGAPPVFDSGLPGRRRGQSGAPASAGTDSTPTETTGRPTHPAKPAKPSPGGSDPAPSSPPPGRGRGPRPTPPGLLCVDAQILMLGAHGCVG